MSAPPQKNNTTKYILGGCGGCGCLTILALLFIFFAAAAMNPRQGGQSRDVPGSDTTIAPPSSNSDARDDDGPADDQSGADESDTGAPAEDSDDQASAPADDMKNAVGQCGYDVKDDMLYGRIESYEMDRGSGEVTYKIAGQGGTVWTKKAANIRVGPCP